MAKLTHKSMAGLLCGLTLACFAQKPMLIINEDNDHYFKKTRT